MFMILRFTFSILLVQLCFQLGAQQTTAPHAVQVSGVVLSEDSLEPVAFASIYRTRDMRGVWTDFNGFFTLPALDGDTLRMVCVGHRNTDVVVRANENEHSVHVIQVMKIDTLNLPTVYILPRPAKEKFREEFLAMEVQTMNTPEALTSKNIYDGLHQMTPDGSENYKRAITDFQNRESNRNYQPNNLLNPFAWAKFIQMLGRGQLNPE